MLGGGLHTEMSVVAEQQVVAAAVVVVAKTTITSTDTVAVKSRADRTQLLGGSQHISST